LDWDYSPSFYQKAVEKYFFDRFFNVTMLDITWLNTQSLRLYYFLT